MDSIGKTSSGLEVLSRITTPPQKNIKTIKPAPSPKSSNIQTDKVDLPVTSHHKPELNLKDIKEGSTIQQAGSTEKTQAIPLTVASSISGHVSGRVGSSHISLSMNRNEDDTNVSGWVGTGSIDINEWKSGNNSTITGYVNAPSGGYQNVNIHSFGTEGNRSINGWMGRDNVFLNESGFAGGHKHISGRVGDRDVDINVENTNGMISINGWIRDMNTHQTENVWISGSQSPPEPHMSCLGLLPAIIAGGEDKGNIRNLKWEPGKEMRQKTPH